MIPFISRVIQYNTCISNGNKITGAYTEAETKKATIKLLRTIVVLTQTLKPLPDDVMMTMKLLYYDHGKILIIIYNIQISLKSILPLATRYWVIYKYEACVYHALLLIDM